MLEFFVTAAGDCVNTSLIVSNNRWRAQKHYSALPRGARRSSQKECAAVGSDRVW
jgi:hypothetical protein